MIDEQRYRELIQQLATGGITGNKTYHQYRDQYIPRDSESMDYAHGGGVGSMMKAKRGLVNEPGGYAGYEGNYYGGGADYMRPLGYVEDETIDVEDLTIPKRIGNFKISAAKPLNDQSGTIAAAPPIMENAGVQSIEGSLINDDFRNDKIRSMVPPNGRFSEFDKARMGAPANSSLGYKDRIMNMVGNDPFAGMNELEKDIAKVAMNTSQEEFDGDFNSDFYNDTTKNMRLEGEPWLAENWNVGDIFNKDTTLTGYQKFPKGDIWNNKDKYLKSNEYLDRIEPSLAGQNFDKRGFQFPNLSNFLPGGILKAIGGKFKRPEQMNEAYQAITDSADDQGYGTYKGNQYKIQDNKIYSELFPHGKNFDSMFGSKSIEEMENEGYGSIGWAQDRLQKGKKISKRLHNILRKRGINKQGNWINRPTYEGAQFKDTIPTGPINKGTSGGYQGPATVSFNPQQFAKSGGQRATVGRGYTNPGKGSYGPWKADGGIINLIKR